MSQITNYYISQDPETLNDIKANLFIGVFPPKQIQDSMKGDELKIYRIGKITKDSRTSSDATVSYKLVSKSKIITLSSDIFHISRDKKWNAKMLYDQFSTYKTDEHGEIKILTSDKFGGAFALSILLFIIALIAGGFFMYKYIDIPVDNGLVQFENQVSHIDDYVQVKNPVVLDAVGKVNKTKTLGITTSSEDGETYILLLDNDAHTYAVKFEKGSDVAKKLIAEANDEKFDGYSTQNFSGVVKDISRLPSLSGINPKDQFSSTISSMNLMMKSGLKVTEPKYLIDTEIKPISGIFKYSYEILLGVTFVTSIVLYIVTSERKRKYIDNLLKK